VRRDIQGLRAVAVIAVILDHLARYPSGGFVGVDVFFVISGFLITDMLIREYERTGTISFIGFYRRRVKRIIPAAVFVLVVTLAGSFVVFGNSRFVSVVKDAVASLFFVGNWRFAITGVDYFQQSLPPSPLQHYWSLSVEEQFYLVWPWLLLGLLLLGVRYGWWVKAAARRVAGSAAAAILVASLAWGLYESFGNSTFAYFSTLSRAWELAIGALGAILLPAIQSRLGKTAPAIRVVLAYVGLAGIIVALFVVKQGDGFPVPGAVLPVLSTALVLIVAAPSDGLALWPLTNPVSRYIGDISYSLYLWHFPVAILLSSFLMEGSAKYLVAGVGLMGLLSVLSYHLIENPARKKAWFRGILPRPGVLVYGLVCIALLASGALGGHRYHAYLVSAAAAAQDAISSDSKCYGAAAIADRADCPALNQGPSVTPLPADAAVDVGNRAICWVGDHQPMQHCVYGSDRPDALKVALFGDSHAAALLPILVPALQDLNWQLTVYTGQDCTLRAPLAVEPTCTALPDMLASVENGGYQVVLATGRRYDTIQDAPTQTAVEQLKNTGVGLVVIEDVPMVPSSTIACLNMIGFSALSMQSCSIPRDLAYRPHDALVDAAQNVPGVVVMPTEQWFCEGDNCPSVIGNVLVYIDDASHVTATYAQTLAPYFLAGLQKAVASALSAG